MTDLPIVQPLTADEITAVLQGAGAIDEEGQSYGTRMKIDGTNFVTENDLWVYNPKTDEPAFTARLIDAPLQYQGFFFTEEFATIAGRPDMKGRFCKSHYDNPNERREYGTNGASCRACPFNPFSGHNPRCQWKGDLTFQIMGEDGSVSEDDEQYTLTLTTTGMIEWRGTKKAPAQGSATDKNFMFKLAELAQTKAEEWGIDSNKAILTALTALSQGMVAAEFRIARKTSDNGAFTWSVPVITPVFIQHEAESLALPEGVEP